MKSTCMRFKRELQCMEKPELLSQSNESILCLTLQRTLSLLIFINVNVNNMEKLESISTLQSQESFNQDLIHKKNRQELVEKWWSDEEQYDQRPGVSCSFLEKIYPAASPVNPSLNSYSTDVNP